MPSAKSAKPLNRKQKAFRAKLAAEKAAKAANGSATPVKLKKPPPINPTPAIRVSFEALRGLLGKGQGHPDVKAVLATAGKIRTTGTHIIADEAGFEFALGRSPDEQVDTRPLVTLFLSAGHTKRTRAFGDLPPPFTFTDRVSLIAIAPPPYDGVSSAGWTRKKGLASVAMPMAQETWKLGKLRLTANYRDNYMRSYTVTT